MKPSEKVKAQKILRRIESGKFDENDIDRIFMILRAYSYENKVFREIADFVAHNDKRTKGLATDSLEALYLSYKYFSEYGLQKGSLDIENPFPIYIKKLMKYQVDKCEGVFLKEEFNLTQQRLKSKIDNVFSEDRKSQTAFLKKPNISKNTRDAIDYLLSFIGVFPAFDQGEIISEFLEVLEANKLDENVSQILKYSDKIIICVMLLLHETNFEYSDRSQGYCKISCDNTCISYKQKSIKKKEDSVDLKEHLGNLNVTGYIETNIGGKNMTASYHLMTTSIPAENWCDNEMFVIAPVNEQDPDYLCKRILFDKHLFLNDNEKIGVIDVLKE